MKRILAPLIASLVIAGCATQIMQGFIGKPIEVPMAQYGPPANTFDLPDGRRAFQWNITHQGAAPYSTTSTTTVYGTGGIATGTTTGQAYVPYSDNCFYTLYATKSGDGWVVSGFEQPRMGC